MQRENKIIQGDCLEVMKYMQDASVDSIVTDPPYELGFMGKSWDSTGIANNVELWKECLRVLKPGGHLLAFSGTRTYHRMASAIEDAGFEVRDMIEWVYGSGFPKSLDISKSLDKRRVKNFDEVRTFLRGEIKKSGLTHNQLLEKLGLAIGSGLITHWTTENKESYQILPSPAQWQNLKKVLNFSSEFDSDIISFEREVVGKRKSLALPISQELKGWGEKQEYDITIPATAEAKQWEGWGTALKPAHEPICMARKPLAEKTVAENCLKWGTGGINIDESRVGVADSEKESVAKEWDRFQSGSQEGIVGYVKQDEKYDLNQNRPLGRFPANLIHDNSEEVRECFPETTVGARKAGQLRHTKDGDLNFTGNTYTLNDYPANSGNASRFFKSIIYQAKASKSERNKGCEGLEEKDGIRTNAPRENENIKTPTRTNNHPTVKPIALMEYLIKMVTPKGGIVLDPFAGSGSTGVACKNLNRNYILIEKEPEYIKIINERLK